MSKEIIVSEWVDHDFDDYFAKEETVMEALIGILNNFKNAVRSYRERFRIWKLIAKGGSVKRIK